MITIKTLQDNQQMKCWIYFITSKNWEGETIQDGDFKRFLNDQKEVEITDKTPLTDYH